MLKSVIKQDMEEIWAVCSVRRKATSGVLIEPGTPELLPEVVEKGEAVPPEDEDDIPLLREVSSSPNSPPSAIGSVDNSIRVERMKRMSYLYTVSMHNELHLVTYQSVRTAVISPSGDKMKGCQCFRQVRCQLESF